MKQRSIRIFIAAAALLSTALASAADNPAFRLAAIFSGDWQGTTPGNNLRIRSTSLSTDPQHQYDLFFEVSGKYQEDHVRLQGVMRFDPEGIDVLVTYVPHFDPTVTGLSPNADVFTDQEARSACGVNFKPRGDGFTSETLGSSCALAIRGATTKWTIEAEPGSLRLRDAKTGETMRFKRVSK
ncbi:MAG TPA: hypothetical protein VIA45_07885 [Thermoanaerobaculia bacterium]|jgi:hypothetical protein